MVRGLMTNLIILINVVVFIFWSFVPIQDFETSFLGMNFLVSWDLLFDGRIWVLLTSIFSHQMFLHLLMNMIVLMNFGPIIETALGSKLYLRFYLVAGVVSSLSHAIVSAWVMDRPELPALGASGSISGVILLFSMMYPRQKILLLGLIPLPAIWGALAFMGLDVWGLLAQAEGGGLPIGHGAHLGGAFTGIVFYFLRVRRRRRIDLFH